MMSHHRRQSLSALCRGSLAAALLVAAVPHASIAAGNPSLPDLNSDSIEVREKAAANLRAWAGTSPDRLLALVNAECTPEQRERLIGLAREVFMATPRGALGVSFGSVRQIGMPVAEELFEEGIPIDMAIEGFDSFTVLKGGDLLRSIDGSRVRTNTQCQQETVSRDKGQVVQLEIEREGRPMRVSVCLGARNDLRTQPLRPEMLEAAWKLRLARSRPDLTLAPAIGDVPAQAWAEADRLRREPIDPEAQIRRASLQQPELQIERLLPDGSRLNIQREGTPTADLVSTGIPRARVSSGTPQSRLLANRPQQFVNAPGGDRDALLQLEQRLREEQLNLLSRIEATSQLANDPNLPREQRQVMRQTLDVLEADLAVNEARIKGVARARRNR
ncbi:MAG: hypothetical protein KF805_10455 [Phycisphaeraceae bacterium]|nr:hypothetical protein [Phycisphaeraceae bacterium]